jgi:hypothetical protein
MKLYEQHNGKPIITEDALRIPQFKKILERDKSKDKTQAYKEFDYIYFKCHFKSLYLSYDATIREQKLVEDFIGIKGWKPDKDLEEAITKFKELQNTASLRFLQANENAMESMCSYFNNINWEEEDSKGRPKYDITKVSNATKQAGGIIDNIEKLKEKVSKEQSLSNSRARGDSVGGLLETVRFEHNV